MHIQTKIKKWGNSLALRLSGPMITIPHFTRDMLVDVQITENGIKIKKARPQKKHPLPFSEADLLNGLTPQKAHADEIITLIKKELGA